MSVNTAHANNGVLIHAGEYILLHSEGVSMEFSGQDNPVFKGTKEGRIYLTSHRMIFNNKKPADSLQSFSAPFVAMSNVELEQPVFNANYIKAKVRAQPNGNYIGEVKFKLRFKAGGAIEYAQALMRAASTAQQNMHRGGGYSDDPPPYTPSGAWHEAPPPAYAPPPGYYGWLPSHDAFTGPAPNTVYMSDNPPPYPGIGGPPPYGAPQQQPTQPPFSGYPPQQQPTQPPYAGYPPQQQPTQPQFGGYPTAGWNGGQQNGEQPQPQGWGAAPPPYGYGSPGYAAPGYPPTSGPGYPPTSGPGYPASGPGYPPASGYPPTPGYPSAAGYPPANGYAPNSGFGSAAGFEAPQHYPPEQPSAPIGGSNDGVFQGYPSIPQPTPPQHHDGGFQGYPSGPQPTPSPQQPQPNSTPYNYGGGATNVSERSNGGNATTSSAQPWTPPTPKNAKEAEAMANALDNINKQMDAFNNTSSRKN